MKNEKKNLLCPTNIMGTEFFTEIQITLFCDFGFASEKQLQGCSFRMKHGYGL